MSKRKTSAYTVIASNSLLQIAAYGVFRSERAAKKAMNELQKKRSGLDYFVMEIAPYPAVEDDE